MATKHWGRDALISEVAAACYSNNQHHANSLLYHFLRVAGFSWIWECDGEVGAGLFNTDCNHVPDGAMEASGVASWTAVTSGGPGPTITKDTTTFDSGLQSLKVVSNNPGDGVRSAILRDMRRAGVGAIAGVAPNMQLNATGNYWFGPGVGVGGYNVTIANATGGNNGTFPVTGYVDHNSISFTNAAGAVEAGVDWATDEPYEVVLRAHNNGTQAWDVEVDRGDGSWTSIGTIPTNAGVWTKHHFSFTLYPGDDSTNPRYIRFVDPATGAAETIYIDGLHIFRSLYEYRPDNVYGTDGQLVNPDRFQTAGSYTPGIADIGKWLFIWDGTNNKNSGYYKIIADIGGGVVQVDMRSGSATFTANTGLTFRIVDIEGQNSNLDYEYGAMAPGWGLESHHTSKWRVFIREWLRPASTYPNKHTQVWGAPEDTDFNVDTGEFYKTGPSTQRSRSNGYLGTAIAPNIHKWKGGYITTNPSSRTFIMTDADGSFFSMVHWCVGVAQHGYLQVGYTGADAKRPGIMEWMLCSRFIDQPTTVNEIGWYSTNAYAFLSITGFSKNGEAVECTFGSSLTNNNNNPVHLLTNAQPNPWSGNEWLEKPHIANDPLGAIGKCVNGEADMGIYRCRENMTDLITFDSNLKLQFIKGLAWEYNGETVVP